MLETCNAISFLATTKPNQSMVFYENVLGLTLTADEPVALVFNINERVLRIVKVD